VSANTGVRSTKALHLASEPRPRAGASLSWRRIGAGILAHSFHAVDPPETRLLQKFLAFERKTTALSMGIACAMLVAAALLGLYQILARFVFQQPAEWSEVLIRFTLIWMVFMGAPAAFRQGAMVCVDLVYRKAGAKGKRIVDWVTAIAALVLVGFMIRYGFDYAWRARVQTISGLESFSMTWAYLAIPVGALFCAVGIVGCLVEPRRHDLETAQ